MTLKSGILGGAHGHYDRLALNSIRRFGKSFYNPENIWYAYHTFMYKFYVQNSITHNMTMVDLKQQDPNETKIIDFYSDEKLQYVVEEITTRWCNPPYGGWRVGENETFADRCWNEGRYLPIPDETPEYTKRSEFTEDIVQRRAVIVTDDYVVVVDYLEGKEAHNFDCLYHASGLKKVAQNSGTSTYTLSEDPQDSRHFKIDNEISYEKSTFRLDDSPLSSGQFITDCLWFKAQDTVKLSFAIEMANFNDSGWLAPLRTAANDSGLLNLDIHFVAPKEKKFVIGNEPEYYQTQQQLFYSVALDDDLLYENKLGTWIFGRDDIELPLKNDGKKLTLTTSSIYVSNEYGSGKDTPLPAIFWGNGFVETASGEKIPLAELPYQMANVQVPDKENRDFFDGPVKLEAEKMQTSLSGTPTEESVPAAIEFDLRDIEPAMLKVKIGADYPLGSEENHRKLIAMRQEGTNAKFVTVLEQFETESVIEQIENVAEGIKVYLKDGSTDYIQINDMTLAKPIISLKKEK